MKKCFWLKDKNWKVMKLCSIQAVIATTLCSMAFAHNNYGQVLDRKVTITLKDVSIEEALQAIEELTYVKFFYSVDQLGITEKMSFQAVDLTLKELLDELLGPYNVNYRVHEGKATITLKRKDGERESRLREASHMGHASVAERDLAMAITGKVTDAINGQPMAGVNVIVKGTTEGTTTDSEGNYNIGAEGRDVLIFSFIGYTTLETQVAGRTRIDVALSEDVMNLEEVEINAGYYRTTRALQTGNITKIGSEQIAKQPVSNPLAALQGRVAGLQIIQSTGLPGGNFKVQIRGRNSIANGNDPLYIIDGVPFVSTTLAMPETSGELFGIGQGFGTSPLNNLNPADIESIEVLKDADATAIYGSRGSNGVILITTKKGEAGKTKVDVNFYTGVGEVASKMDLLSSQQYLEMRREAFRNDNLPIASPQADDLLQWDTTRYTDWQEELIGGTAHTEDAQLSVSGGDSETQFLVNGGYHRETTVFPGDDSDRRISTHFNVNHKSADQKFGALVSFSYSAGSTDLIKQDLTGTASTLPPVAPAIYDEEGNLNWQNSTWVNPLSYLKRNYEAETNTLIGNAVLSYVLVRGLQLKASVGFTNTGTDAISTAPISSYNPAFAAVSQNETAFSQNNFQNWVVEPQLNWTSKIRQSTISVLIGGTLMAQESKNVAQIGKGFSSEALMRNLQSASIVSISSDNFSAYRYSAIFGRINYVLHEKYILNITGRRDGSSRFGPGNQFANFGAAGMAWLFSNENFFRNAFSFVSFGKLRASYGVTGNDQLGDYEYLNTYTSSAGSYYGSIGLLPVRLSNPDFAWETNEKAEASLEIGFFQDRILLTSSIYRNRSSNQLVGFPLPPTTGFSSIQGNFPATVQNSGVELQIETRNINSDDVRWTSSVNLTVPRNKLIEFPDLETFPAYANTYVVGEPLNIRKVFHYTGLDPVSGLYQFADVNADGSLTTADRQTVIDLKTNFYGGLQNGFTYKGLELTFLLQFVKQTGNNYLYGWSGAPGTVGNQPSAVIARWQESGDQTAIQRYTTDLSSPYRFIRNSDLSIGDASFVRLKNVSLSYSFPNEWLSKVRVRNARLFVQGQNLFTITKYDGFNPENQLSRILPPLRVLTTGLHFTL